MNKVAKISLDSSSTEIGRIGGNIPTCFLEKKENIEGFKFYMTIQNPDNSDEYLSIFVPDSYDTMVDENIYPNCSIKVFTHSFSDESRNSFYTLEGLRKSSIMGYKEVENGVFDFVTKTQHPQLIQDEDYYFKKLEEDGFTFYLQIDEDYYPENLLSGNYILGYGAIFLYKHNKTGNIIAGFWQYS
ncbi:Uncharacterised protein [Prevotella melaninogenica]|uniref:hypothetical protein n=1 Tax=Prevotella melaninogenica TaxID=28132 RepID=UPI00195D5228|nr:hypothetical protein [Prevotella melaninogenica]VTY04937.1 Uncharacterised protein [Prevotella melaninogenica]